MNKKIIWLKNDLTIIERNIIVFSFTASFLTGIFLIMILSHIRFYIEFNIIITIGLLSSFVAIIPYYFVFRHFSSYPDLVGISNKAIYFKKGKKQKVIFFNNVKGIKIFFKRDLELKLIQPKIILSYRLTSYIIDRIQTYYNKYKDLNN